MNGNGMFKANLIEKKSPFKNVIVTDEMMQRLSTQTKLLDKELF